jgi:hypothetical protein
LYILIFMSLDSRLDTKILDWMVASITRIPSPLNFLLNQVLICHSCSQISEMYRIFETSVTYLNLVNPNP